MAESLLSLVQPSGMVVYIYYAMALYLGFWLQLS
jgi:hypothetical protein